MGSALGPEMPVAVQRQPTSPVRKRMMNQWSQVIQSVYYHAAVRGTAWASLELGGVTPEVKNKKLLSIYSMITTAVKIISGSCGL